MMLCYGVVFWTCVFHHCPGSSWDGMYSEMFNAPMNTLLILINRSKLNCQSYMLRKNRNRTDVSSRVKCGPRLDGILYDSQDRSHEFCAIESAPAQSGGSISTKSLNEKAKLLKVQREMLSRLAIEAKHESQVVDNLQVFGISTTGLTMQISRMCHRKGYVSLLMVHDPQTVPHDVRQLSEFLVLLAAVVKTKVLGPLRKDWTTINHRNFSLVFGIRSTFSGIGTR